MSITRRAFLTLPALLPGSAPAPEGALLFIGDSLSRGAFASNLAAAYAARVAVALGAADTCLQRPVRDLDEAERAWPAVAGRAWGLVILEIGINDTISGPLTQGWAARYRALIDAMGPERVVACTPFDIGVPELAQDLEARAEAIRGAGARLADLYAATRGRGDLRARTGALTFYGDATVAQDDMHPNDAGHALIAQVILASLRSRVSLPLVH